MKMIQIILSLMLILLTECGIQRTEKCYSSFQACERKMNSFKEQDIYPDASYIPCLLKGNQYCFYIEQKN